MLQTHDAMIRPIAHLTNCCLPTGVGQSCGLDSRHDGRGADHERRTIMHRLHLRGIALAPAIQLIVHDQKLRFWIGGLLHVANLT